MRYVRKPAGRHPAGLKRGRSAPSRQEQLVAGRIAGLRAANEHLRQELAWREKVEPEWLREDCWQAVPVGVAYLARDFTLRFCNRECAEMLRRFTRFTAEQAIGRSYFELLDLPRPKAREMFERVVASGQAETMTDYKIIAKRDGCEEATYWNGKIAPVFDSHGRVEGLRLCVAEVTARVRAEQSLRDSERLYRTLVEASPDGIVIVRRDLRVQYGNVVAAQMLGIDLETLAGRPLSELLPP
jgi:PAS domain S-box-containing protein